MAIPLPPVSGPRGKPDPKVQAVGDDDEPTPLEAIQAMAAAGDALAQWALDVEHAFSDEPTAPDSS